MGIKVVKNDLADYFSRIRNIDQNIMDCLELSLLEVQTQAKQKVNALEEKNILIEQMY